MFGGRRDLLDAGLLAAPERTTPPLRSGVARQYCIQPWCNDGRSLVVFQWVQIVCCVSIGLALGIYIVTYFILIVERGI